MAFENLSSASLRQLIGLIRKKESLQAKLDRVESALRGLGSGSAPTGPGRGRGRRRGRPPGRKAGAAKAAAAPAGKAGRRKRGARLKGPLLKALKAGGASGVTVKDLAAKLKVKPGNVFSWFYTTGKKISGIKKVGEARYSYNG